MPAYTIPKAGRDRWGNNYGPGPADYNDNHQKLSVHPKLPLASFNRAGLRNAGELSEVNVHKSYTPGPGDYDTNQSSLSKRGRAVIGDSKRNFVLGKEGLPGPGDYEVSK